MPLFNSKNDNVSNLKLQNFKSEKTLQTLIEKNLQVFFNCRFVATEFSTGVVHGGRIDTLALSEDNNPVIIEYKTSPSSDLLNQSLFYLSWMTDHKGDFEVIARKALGNDVEIDFSDIRVICIAPDYKKYDLHAAKSMGANIELWSYKLFENGYLIMDEVYSKSGGNNHEANTKKDPKMVNAGKKAAITRKLATHSLSAHQDKTSNELWEVFEELREFILDLDSSIQEVPKFYYIAYKTSQNFACIEFSLKKLKIFLKINPKSFKHVPNKTRDVTDVGHVGTGNLECTISSAGDLVWARDLIKMSFDNIGG